MKEFLNFTIFDQKKKIKCKRKLIEAQVEFELMTYRFIANALTLFGNSVGKENYIYKKIKLYIFILDFLFISIGGTS